MRSPYALSRARTLPMYVCTVPRAETGGEPFHSRSMRRAVVTTRPAVQQQDRQQAAFLAALAEHDALALVAALERSEQLELHGWPHPRAPW